MAYERTEWEDRIVEFPNRFKITKENGTEEIVTIEKLPGEIQSEGTLVSASRMNNIEEGIEELERTKVDLENHHKYATYVYNGDEIEPNYGTQMNIDKYSFNEVTTAPFYDGENAKFLEDGVYEIFGCIAWKNTKKEGKYEIIVSSYGIAQSEKVINVVSGSPARNGIFTQIIPTLIFTAKEGDHLRIEFSNESENTVNFYTDYQYSRVHIRKIA